MRDHGSGIGAADLPHLFERFYRGAMAKDGRRAPAWDSSIVRGLVAAAGGRVWAENAPDGGAVFTMAVPADVRAGEPGAGRRLMSVPSRILLVDDETAIQRAVAPLLRARGYEVEVAGTGVQALQAAADRPPDLIVLDLGLPDLEGTEVCRRVRATSAVPILVLSARGAEADKVQALDLGADDYVTKPFGPEELLARIRVALRRRSVPGGAGTGPFIVGEITIDEARRRVLRPASSCGSRPRSSSCCPPRPEPRSRPHPQDHPQGDLGAERGRAARAPLDAGRPAPPQDRARSLDPEVPPQRALGRLPVRRRRP